MNISSEDNTYIAIALALDEQIYERLMDQTKWVNDGDPIDEMAVLTDNLYYQLEWHAR